MEIARAKGLHVIEDAVQAIGTQDCKGKQAGTIGDIGCFSFFPSKNLGAFGGGGMVVTNEQDVAEVIKVLRVHGAKPKYHRRIVRGNFRLDVIQAAVLREKLEYLSTWIKARRLNATCWRSLFDEFDSEDVPDLSTTTTVLSEGKGVETEIYYPVTLHLQDCFAELGYRPKDFPHVEAVARDSLALPIYPELIEAQLRYVVAKIAEFYSQ